MIDAFLAANGVARLIFFYQEPEAPPPDAGGTKRKQGLKNQQNFTDILFAVEHFRLGAASGNRPVKAGKPKVFVTDAKSVPLHGWCLVFTRTNTKMALQEADMAKEVNFMTMDAGAKNSGHGLLQAVENILSSVFIPSLKKLDKGWGNLDSAATSQTKTDFLNNLDSFVAVLTGNKKQNGRTHHSATEI